MDMVAITAIHPRVEQSAIRGEPGTGFEKADAKGPFECGNCRYMAQGACTNAIMKKLSKQPRNEQGNVLVDEKDCCEYVWRGKGH